MNAATALVLVDMQAAALTGDDAIAGATQVHAAVQVLLARARAAGSLVVHVQNDGPAGAPDEPGTAGWGLVTAPTAGEHVVHKRDDDAFVGTGLGELLDQHAVRRLVLCGAQSEMCVAATARGAMARGLEVVLSRDAHGTYAVPAAGDAPAVPAEHVARVAEWALGDGLVVVDVAEQVVLGRATPVVDPG